MFSFSLSSYQLGILLGASFLDLGQLKLEFVLFIQIRTETTVRDLIRPDLRLLAAGGKNHRWEKDVGSVAV